MSISAIPRQAAVWPVAVRAAAIGVAVTAAAVTVVLISADEGLLEAAARPFLIAGAIAGAVTGSLGNLVVARGALLEVGGPKASADFVRAIVMDFALQVFAVTAGTLGLFLLGVKFPGLAAFGIALAGGALLCRVPGTALVSRALNRRARDASSSRDLADRPSPERAPTPQEPER